MTDTFKIVPKYDILLRGSELVPYGIYHLHVSIAEQLTRLYYKDGMLTTVKARLKDLADNGYLQVGIVPRRNRGEKRLTVSGHYYYTLGDKGIRYLSDIGYDTNRSWKAKQEVDKNDYFLAHSLELNDVIISAVRTGQLEDFRHERLLKRNPFKTTYNGAAITVIPDAVLKFRGGRLILEHDRGSEEQYKFRRRIRGYLAYFREERLPVIFTTFKGQPRVEQMREWTRLELKDTEEPEEYGLLFHFANLSQPPSPQIWTDQCWQDVRGKTLYPILQP